MSLDYKLISQESECTGGETYKGFKSSHAECANACRDKSQMFIYAINKNDKTKCDNGKCKCFCELGTHNYKCNSRKKNKDWALFAFVVGKLSLDNHLCNLKLLDHIELQALITFLTDINATYIMPLSSLTHFVLISLKYRPTDG